ncbi:MAG: hypothetical protein AAGC46_18550 [Solirubrobacteraceae bacterium]|nr:hypothetical protein [Patulibacter sp.]
MPLFDTDPADESPDPNGPLFDDEGDIDEDRQDAPRPEKVDGEDGDLDGTAATPGDDVDDD